MGVSLPVLGICEAREHIHRSERIEFHMPRLLYNFRSTPSDKESFQDHSSRSPRVLLREGSFRWRKLTSVNDSVISAAPPINDTSWIIAPSLFPQVAMPYTMLVSDEENTVLLDENDDEGNLPPRSLCQRCPFLRLLVSPMFLWVVIIVETIGFAAFMAHVVMNEEKAPYSPVNDAISYKYQSFFQGLGQDLSPFQAPPSKELDQRWQGLYSLGMSRISRYEAAKLPNATAPIPGDKGHYVVELDVFHQLRCLDRIRRTIYSDYYPEAHISVEDNEEYVSHCVDSIRQSLMCSSDVSLLVWQWDEAALQSRIRTDVVHRCRDFDNVKGWALHRQLKGGFNPSVRVH